MSTSITPENAINIVSMWSKSRSRTCHSRYFSQKIILFYIGYPFQVPWLFLGVISECKFLQMLGSMAKPSSSSGLDRDQQLSSIHLLEYVMHDKCWCHPLTTNISFVGICLKNTCFHDCCHLSFAENPANGPPPCLNGWSTAARISIRPRTNFSLTHPPGRATKFAGFGISFV